MYGELMKQLREAAGFKVKDLASRLACTDSFINLLESERRLPSIGFLMGFIDACRPSDTDQQRLLEAVEAARRQRAEQKEEARNAALQGALRLRSVAAEATTAGSEEIPSEDEWQRAVRDMRTAYANPETRKGLLATLRAFAVSASTQVDPGREPGDEP